MVSIPICQASDPDLDSLPGRIPYKQISGAYQFSAQRFADLSRGDYVNIDTRMSTIEAGTAISKKNVIRGFHCSPFPKIVGCLSGRMFDVLLDLRPKSPTFMKTEWIMLEAVGMTGTMGMTTSSAQSQSQTESSKTTTVTTDSDNSGANGANANGTTTQTNSSNQQSNPTYIYIPPGVGHAYLALEDNTLTLYLKGGKYDTSKELNLNVYCEIINASLNSESKKELTFGSDSIVLPSSSGPIPWPIPKEQHIISDKDLKQPNMKELIELAKTSSSNLLSEFYNLLSKPKKIWYAPNKFESYGDAEILAVTKCLRDGWLAPGPKTTEFEQKVAKYFGKKYGIMVNSGSSANLIGLAAHEFPKGSEIITPVCTFSTVLAPIEQLGLTPVFLDVELRTYVPSDDAILNAITEKTKMIMVPNLVGSKPNWKYLKEECVKKGRSDIILFEDSCDCMTYTPESDVSAISFYASHIITAGGQGGIFMCNDENVLKRCYMYRDWGRVGNNSEEMDERFKDKVDDIEYDGKFLYSVQGYNMKSCEMCASFGLEQMKKLNQFTSIRRRNIQRFVENIKNKFPSTHRYILPRDDYNDMDWLALPLQHPNRGGVIRYLEKQDVQIRVTFAGNVTRHPAYRHHYKEYENSDLIMKNGFLIGAHHGITEVEVDRVCEVLKEFDELDREGKIKIQQIDHLMARAGG